MGKFSTQKLPSRQEKRHAKVTYKGKVLRVSEWLQVVSSELPNMTFADGRKVDHHAELKHFYMKDGIKGANAYINHCRKILNQDYRKLKIKKFWDKVKNFLGVYPNQI